MLSTTIDNSVNDDFLEDGEELPMTMQVGMVGVDGIVLVSDQLANSRVSESSFAQKLGVGVTAFFGPSKLFVDPEEKMVVACAHDLRHGKTIAEVIFQKLTPEFWAQPILRLKEIANEVVAAEGWNGSHCLILLSQPISLYLMQCSPKNCEVDIIGLYVFSGDPCNPATFWAHRFFKEVLPNERTIQKMLPLASQVVVDAGNVSSGNVGGLEAVYCDASGIHNLRIQKMGNFLRQRVSEGSN
jgi:hypothetical protein